MSSFATSASLVPSVPSTTYVKKIRANQLAEKIASSAVFEFGHCGNCGHCGKEILRSDSVYMPPFVERGLIHLDCADCYACQEPIGFHWTSDTTKNGERAFHQKCLKIWQTIRNID
jgi:hypothetical protein